jgi:hypothetical protein
LELGSFKFCFELSFLITEDFYLHPWGNAVINGTEEYKRLCVELAIRHNLKIANPELAVQVEEGRKNMSQRHQQEVNNIDRKTFSTVMPRPWERNVSA